MRPPWFAAKSGWPATSKGTTSPGLATSDACPTQSHSRLKMALRSSACTDSSAYIGPPKHDASSNGARTVSLKYSSRIHGEMGVTCCGYVVGEGSSMRSKPASFENSAVVDGSGTTTWAGLASDDDDDDDEAVCVDIDRMCCCCMTTGREAATVAPLEPWTGRVLRPGRSKPRTGATGFSSSSTAYRSPKHSTTSADPLR
mmetsp:Transcript_11518/g.46626  ORF Transcript_11518/g.46626 Transcript_11518/m.46626 type:complete len:200 (-) Transcript_11518:701-1300(-)